MPIELSVIMLCYGAGEALRGLAAQAVAVASALSARYEVILVANYLPGSSDRTTEIAAELAGSDSAIRIISLPKRGMMGWDMKAGLKAASGEYLCVIDGDGQFPMESIISCYREITSGRYDLVKTYRSSRSDGFYRKMLSFAYNQLFALFFPGLRCNDVNSKPKIMTRSAYERMVLTADDWFIDAEIMLNVRRNRMAYHEIPVEFGALEERPSFVSFKAVLEFIKNLIAYRIAEFRNHTDGK